MQNGTGVRQAFTEFLCKIYISDATVRNYGLNITLEIATDRFLAFFT